MTYRQWTTGKDSELGAPFEPAHLAHHRTRAVDRKARAIHIAESGRFGNQVSMRLYCHQQTQADRMPKL